MRSAAARPRAPSPELLGRHVLVFGQLWPSMVTTSGSTAAPRRAPSSIENITEESVTIFHEPLASRTKSAGLQIGGDRTSSTRHHAV